MEDLAAQLLPDIAKGASKDALLLAMIWWMLRDVRAKVTTLTTELSALKDLAIHLSYAQKRIDETRDTITLLQNELKAVWRVIGNRPEDKAG